MLSLTSDHIAMPLPVAAAMHRLEMANASYAIAHAAVDEARELSASAQARCDRMANLVLAANQVLMRALEEAHPAKPHDTPAAATAP